MKLKEVWAVRDVTMNHVQSAVPYDFTYVDQESFEAYRPQTFQEFVDTFTEYKDE